MREETGLPVLTADDPLSSVVLGCGKVLDEIDLLENVAVSACERAAHGRRVVVGTALLILISLALVIAQSHSRSLDSVNRAVAAMTAPLHEFIAVQAMGLKTFWTEYADLRDVHSANEGLERRMSVYKCSTFASSG